MTQSSPVGSPRLRRRNIFDGRTPWDFIDPTDQRGWPRGRLVNVLHDDPPKHDSPEAAKRWQAEAESAFEAVFELAVLVEDYLDWKGRQSTQSIARRLRVSRDRLTALEVGARFPDWDLPWRIKSLIDPAPERKADRGRY